MSLIKRNFVDLNKAYLIIKKGTKHTYFHRGDYYRRATSKLREARIYPTKESAEEQLEKLHKIGKSNFYLEKASNYFYYDDFYLSDSPWADHISIRTFEKTTKDRKKDYKSKEELKNKLKKDVEETKKALQEDITKSKEKLKSLEEFNPEQLIEEVYTEKQELANILFTKEEEK